MEKKEILQVKLYRPAQLYTGKCWYIDYYVYHPIEQRMICRRIKLNHIKSKRDRRQYAYGLIRRLNTKLEQGWNPFIESEKSKSFQLFTEAMGHFIKLYTRKYEQEEIREETYYGYVSYAKIVGEYIEEKKLSGMFIYQFDRAFITDFLDYVYLQRNNSATTRDNYLTFLRVFSGFLVQYGYHRERPTDGIFTIAKSKHKKSRIIITPEDRKRLSGYLADNDKWFLLACHILYFCFVRPKEMSYIKIGHINIEKQTLYIPGKTAKNYKDGVITIPQEPAKLMIELGVFNYPKDYYLFSDHCMPGINRHDEKQFRDRWKKVKQALSFPNTYQFYSLKDTGITNMLSKGMNTITVRDQARHHSLSMTDIYTPHEIINANPAISEMKDKF